MSDRPDTPASRRAPANRRPSRRPGSQEAGGPPAVDGLSPYAWLFLGVIVVLLALGLWTWLVAVLGLALLIFVHESGHFLLAKLFHMRVERFYIGFPPAAIKRTWGETEYGIGLVPLGGFCKISGMTPEEEVPDEVKPRAYYNKPVWQRNLTILAGPMMNIVGAVVILFVFVVVAGVPNVDKPTLTIAEVRAGTPAAAAGLKAGDRLVGADGVTFQRWDQATAFFLARPRQTIDVRYVTAAGAQKTVAVTLAIKDGNVDQGFLGVGPGFVTDHPAPWTAAWVSVKQTGLIVSDTFRGFWLLITGKIDPTGPQGATGPVGIVRVSAQAVHQSWYPILLALISVNLGIINLLPILPFDGGHIMVNTVEKLRGRRLDPRVFERVVTIGVMLLVTLFIFLTWNDLHHLGG